MNAMKSLLVGAAACAAVAAAPAVVSLPRRDANPNSANSDATANLKTMTLHGDRVAYRDEGAGEVLLLVHGMGGSSNSWSGVIPLLAKKYRVIAPDLLGHGESDKPRGDYSVGAFAVLLRDLLDALGRPPSHRHRSLSRWRDRHAIRPSAPPVLRADRAHQQRRVRR